MQTVAAKGSETYVCQRCGNCCKWPGYVRLTAGEIDAISHALGMDGADFLARYTELTRDRRSLTLTERDDGACVFLDDDDKCIVNEVKPKQCRDFPNLWNFPGWRSKCHALASDTEPTQPEEQENE